MNFQISLLGLNHRSASVDIRERYNLADCAYDGPFPLRLLTGISESYLLSTCNRVEILAVGEPGYFTLKDDLLSAWARAVSAQPQELGRYIYSYQDLDAVRHLFTVASSLDSMVLGEPQILGQMKAAYRKAVEAKSAGVILNRLLHRAFFVAKRVRHETAIAASAVSISYAAVELAKKIFGSMPSHRAMLIGAGEMAELAATHLLQAGIDEIIVVNRTYEHGEELARKFHGRAIKFEDLAASLSLADIIISSTGSREPLINAAYIKDAMSRRKNSPMFLIDIAVPRDIEPAVNEIDNVYLYDIDDLRDVVEENMAGRREEAAAAELIVAEEATRFGQWLENLSAKPTILDLLDRSEKAVQAELRRTLRRLGPVTPETRKALELMGRGIAKRLNHDPITYLKAQGMGKDDPHGRISEVRRIFNLDDQKKQ